jgi:hypothetical protein
MDVGLLAQLEDVMGGLLGVAQRILSSDTIGWWMPGFGPAGRKDFKQFQ